ncbi:SH3 domain-containing protein [Alisedimentitalea sp. MJ-SS2]|uniref:SH3 domain-containing protein n=1 Tax=Aliisedimentitalea sp. MJ-SS2 TaxID=3049795 RepID=UPI002912E0D3|nr:SH3 domain-containing protein [Alisedimentitalea sp. MJ-SS2]MDU8926940.1 SH3 domain-containing protein [Alisedimentitalea sp. MJ-SS2]
MKRLLIATATIMLISGCMVSQAAAQKRPEVPIMLHPDTEHGTCSIGFQVNAGGATLRSGPGVEYPVIATLKAGHVVAGCNHQNGWEGVIDGQDESCSIGIMVTSARPYEGTCKSGWVEEKALTSIYG